MIIIEGIRRSGKTHTVNLLKTIFNDVIFFKDASFANLNPSLDPDSFAIGRDCAYAQFLPTLDKSYTDRLLFDRQYWSSYVYGQIYRDRYQNFWENHIRNVEGIYGDNLPKILFITLETEDIKRISNMDRTKDGLETTNEAIYLKQYIKYTELFGISNADIYMMKAFQDDEYIIEFFKHIMAR